MSGAMDKTVRLVIGSGVRMGSVLVTMISAIPDWFSRWAAGPEKTGWVAAQMTAFAPCSRSACAAWAMVPAVSIMSSTSRQTRSLTSPTTSCTATVLAWLGSRRLWMIASGQPSLSVHTSARRTRPASGDTIVISEVSYFSLT